jgi:hypothetical protein
MEKRLDVHPEYQELSSRGENEINAVGWGVRVP